MNKPWFEKKKWGWGWGLPLRWQGWLTLMLFVAFIASLDLITTNQKLYIPLVLIAVGILFAIMRVTSGKPQWANGAGYSFDNKRMLRFVILLVSLAVIISITQIVRLKRAHSTFENYYQFRHCVQLLEKTDTSATCRLASGNTITIVEINNKWYLQGDGPRAF